MNEQSGLHLTDSPSKRKIARAAAIALVAATVVLFTIVLPAEYGIDPLRTGAAFGLADLSQARQVGAVTPQSSEYKLDSAQFTLRPSEWVEYKYRLEKGGSMLYSWKATGEVVYDMHSEPEGAAPGYAESFDKGKADRGHGFYTAPFPGIHGWYWKNPGKGELTVTLATAGFYSFSKEFRKIDPASHELLDIKRGMVQSKK